jgi:hypothetical protein
MVKNYFDTMYPEFEPEVISTFEKQYYLPALKILKKIDGEYFSPGYTAKWTNGELVAECKRQYPTWSYSFSNNGAIEERIIEESIIHQAPYPGCDCGIYGSVNLDEVFGYRSLYIHENIDFSLCIIEPYPDSSTLISRKGWKTSHAFISEIVGETISIEDARQLLSMAWNRSVDVRKCYNENR